MHVSAVVFDLDDTLIDTTGQLLEPAHREAAAAMIAAGLSATLPEVAEKRMDFNRAEPGCDVDRRVAVYFAATDPEKVARAGHDAFYRRTVRRLEPIEGAVDVLAALACRRFLLTSGDADTQLRKLALAGLETHFEEVVCVPPRAAKEAALRDLLARHGLVAHEVVVIGDRLDNEIAAARAVGAWGVRVAAGEGSWAEPRGAAEQPHYTVPSVEALPAVLEDIGTRAGGPADD